MSPIPSKGPAKSPTEPLHSLMDLDVPVAGKSLLPKTPLQKRKYPEIKQDVEISQEQVFVKATPPISTNKNPLPNIGNSRDNLWSAAKPVPKFVEPSVQPEANEDNLSSKHEAILENIKNTAIQISKALKSFTSTEQVVDFKNSLFDESSGLKSAIKATYSLDKNILDQIRPTIKEYLDYIDSEILTTYNSLNSLEDENTQKSTIKPSDVQEDFDEPISLEYLNPGQWFALYEGNVLCFASDKEDLREKLNHHVLNENISIESIKTFKCVNVDFGIIIEE
jgi:hypothetical protein